MVISSDGLHIGYIPKYDAPDVKRKLLFEPIYGWVSESTDRCYEFLIDIESVTDMEEYNNAMEAYNNRKRQEQERADYIRKIVELNFYEGLHDARMKYDQGLYDEAEQILKPFFENKIQENTCYVLQICIHHIKKEYEAEEKLIDEFFEYDNITENERMGLKRRKYHILRQMGVIVDNAQIEAEKVGVETTVLELDGYAIVEDLLRDIVDPNRIDFRDSKTLFSINLDNSRKPICKFYFNNPNKMYMGLISSNFKLTNGKDTKICEKMFSSETFIPLLNIFFIRFSETKVFQQPNFRPETPVLYRFLTGKTRKSPDFRRGFSNN